MTEQEIINELNKYRMQEPRKKLYKRLTILDENGNEIGSVNLKQDIYDDLVATLDTDDIKYEIIDRFDTKAKTLIIFNRYILNSNNINANTIIRISYATSYRDFLIPKNAQQQVLNALKRASYRISKINKINRFCQNPKKLKEQFSTLPGDSLSEIIEKSVLSKLKNENKDL